MLESFLNCIFGAEKPLSDGGRTAESVCEGSTEVKVLHCMRCFLNCQPFTGFSCVSVCVLTLRLNVE